MNIPDILLGLGQRPASVSMPRGVARSTRSAPVDFERLLGARSGPCLSATGAESSADAAPETATVGRQDSYAPSAVQETEEPAQDAPPRDERIEETPADDVGPQAADEVGPLAAAAAQAPVATYPSDQATAGPSETATALPSDNAAVVLPGAALLDSVSVKAALSGSTALAAGEAASSAAQALQGEVAGQTPNADQGAPAASLLLPQDTPTGVLLPGTEEAAPSLRPWSAGLRAAVLQGGTETSAASGVSAPLEEMDAASLLREAWTDAVSARSSPAALSEAAAEEGGASRPAADSVRVGTAAPREAADFVRTGQGPPPATETDTGVHGAAKADAGPALPERVSLEVVRDFTVRSVRYLVTRGERTVTIRLVPESLGELHLEVTSAKEGVFVRLMSANPAVRGFLSEGLKNLRVVLAESGVEVADVVVTTDMASGHPAGEGGNPQWAGPAGSPGSAAWGLDGAAEAGPAHATMYPHEGALNVLV